MFWKVSIALLISSMLFSGCKDDKRHLTISKIRSVVKLSTTETIIDKVVVGEKTKKFLGLVKLGDADFVAYSEATIKTGVDLSKMKARDVRIDGAKIEVDLPPIEVLDFQYPFTSFRIDENLCDKDLLVKIDVIDQEYYFRQAELDIRKNLKYTGIVEQTEINTRKILEGLLQNLGYMEVYINFDESEELIQQIKVDDIPVDEE